MVIVVDDDESIGKIIQRICKIAGLSNEYYGVWEDARQAIDRQPGKYNCAVIDLGLPEGASGLKASEWLQQHYPHIRCVLISGVGHKPQSYVEDPPHRVFLRKPFLINELTRAIIST